MRTEQRAPVILQVPASEAGRTYPVYVVSDAWMDEHSPGAAAYRSGPKDGGDDGTEHCVFRESYWPVSAIAPGYYRVYSLLSAFQRTVNRDTFLHEVGGHEVMGWGHDYPNAVMQGGSFRKKRSRSDYEYDRRVLSSAVRSAYDTIYVTRGPPSG